ncbi:MAG: glycine cleavage T C-terminal barrel domain-containing protein, partial [Actinomycetota bacterium]
MASSGSSPTGLRRPRRLPGRHRPPPRDSLLLRDGCELRDSTGATVGRVTSGNFSPSLGHCVAMAFVDRPCSIGEVLLA